MSSCVHNLFEKMSCAPNLYIKKIVKRGKLEKKETKKPHVGARADGAARERPRAILVLRAPHPPQPSFKKRELSTIDGTLSKV
jgi:hypothetical protein